MDTNSSNQSRKRDIDLSIPEYWNRYCYDIASLRRWTQEADGTIPTLNGYNRMIEKLAPELPDKPIGQTTLSDLINAVNRVRNKARGGNSYSPSSLNGFYALLGDIFRYAKDHGHADNILLFLQDSRRGKDKQFADFFDPSLSIKQLKEKARKMIRENPSKVKSLTKRQRLSLCNAIADGITKDGRFMALAIMLYGGLRPSECRALRWGDIRPFLDHPDRGMFVLCKTQGKKGKARSQMKTQNAYRYMPIHCELDRLLKLRYEYVKNKLSVAGKDIDKLPICSFKNYLFRFCEDFQFSAFGSDILNQLKVPRSDLVLYMAYMITDDADASGANGEEPTHLSLYILRRNFCTWVQGETQMDEMQRNYVMGHAMLDGKKDIRWRYNGEDSLFCMLQMMDTAVLNGNYARAPYDFTLSPDTPIDVANRGRIKVHIPPPPAGYTVQITAIAAEPDCPITISADDPAAKKIIKAMQAETISLARGESFPPLNTECDEWDAWKAVIAQSKGRLQNSDEALAEDEF